MRLIACVTTCLVPILADAAQLAPQTSFNTQAYCVNRSADFYPYTGEPCKSGYLRWTPIVRQPEPVVKV